MAKHRRRRHGAKSLARVQQWPPLAAPALDAPAEPPALPREPLDLWSVVTRHGRLIAGCALLAAVAAVVVSTRTAPTFAATASIRIDEKPTAPPALEALGLSQGNELATELEILKSRALAEEVVDSLALPLVVRTPAGAARGRIFSQLRAARADTLVRYRLVASNGAFTLVDRESGRRLSGVTIRPGVPFDTPALGFALAPSAAAYGTIDFDVRPFRDAVDDALLRDFDVARRGKDADIVDVTYRGADPALARDVANLLARRFVDSRQAERHAEARNMVGFLGDQLGRVSLELDASENALRAFREREHVVSLPDEASNGLSRQAELQAQRNTLAAERAALDQLLRSARRAAPGTVDSSYHNLLAFPTLMRSGTAAALLGPLATVEEQRNDLIGRRTARDPDMQRLTARLAQIHGEIESMVDTYLQGLTNQVAALDNVLAGSAAALRSIPRKEIQLAELERNAKSNEETYSLLRGRLQEAQIAEAAIDPSVRLVDPAVMPRKPVAPRPLINLSLALVAGALVGLAGASARELSDRSLHTRRELLATAGVPVVGVVPHALPRAKWLPTWPRGGASPVDLGEAFSSLATNLVFLRQPPETPMRVMVVTSALPGDGKTTVALHLGMALARHGRRVLLVDADLRRGRLAAALGVPPGPGLSEALADGTPLDAAVTPISLPTNGGGGLSLLAAGAAPTHPAQLLASERARELLDQARADYDVTIVDSPPMNVAADAALIAPRSDGVIIVARAGVTERGAIGLAMEQLAMVHAPVAGAVLNAVDLQRDSAYDRAYRYYGRYDIAKG